MNQAPKQDREVYEVVGDTRRGIASTMNMANTAEAHPLVFYRDRVLEVDLFAMPGHPKHIHLLCPHSTDEYKHSLRIPEERKAIDFEPDAIVRIPSGFTLEALVEAGLLAAGAQIRGRLNVEAFGCTWEAEPELRRQFGLSACAWRVVIENNVARDV